MNTDSPYCTDYLQDLTLPESTLPDVVGTMDMNTIRYGPPYYSNEEFQTPTERPHAVVDHLVGYTCGSVAPVLPNPEWYDLISRGASQVHRKHHEHAICCAAVGSKRQSTSKTEIKV